MSGNHTSRWIKLLHQLYRAAPEFSTKNVLVPGACFACGSVLLYFASNKSNSKIFKNSFTDKSFVAYAAAPKLHSESKVEFFIIIWLNKFFMSLTVYIILIYIYV